MYEQIETARLILRRPRAEDAEAVFSRYASDREVTRMMGWPRHLSVETTRKYIEYSDEEWAQGLAGPYLIESRQDGRLLGGTGLGFETPYRASTGYVLAKDAWGYGYATEALRAMVDLARQTGVMRLYAIYHVEHTASARVLEKCGFVREGVLRKHLLFPNLNPNGPCDVYITARILS